MGYRKIPNLYKCQNVLMFKEVYVSEKIHGTSAHVTMTKIPVGTDELAGYMYNIDFFSGGASHDLFTSLFNKEKLIELFEQAGFKEITIYGEAYGGKLQGMRDTYGDKLKFIVFEIKIGDSWLSMDRAEYVAEYFNLEFIWYARCNAEVDILDMYRDQPSQQAKRNDCGDDKKAEGIVIRPLMELTINNKGRILAKHKRADFRETKTQRKVVDLDMQQILKDADSISEEWVTAMRLAHVLDKMKAEGIDTGDMKSIPQVIKAMQKDIKEEAEGEIVYTKAAGNAIAKSTVKLFKKRLNDNI